MSLDSLASSEEGVRHLLEQWSSAARRSVSVEALIAQWRRVVDRTETGYQLSLDDYLNDVDARVMLEEVTRAAHGDLRDELREALAPLDARFVTATEVTSVLRREDPWGGRVPRRMGHEMRAQLQDLERAQRQRTQ